MRLNTSSAPTTGSAMAVARATIPRNRTSIRRTDTPLASPSSGETELSSNGRNRITIRATEHRAEHGDRPEVRIADAEHLAEQERVDRLKILGGPAQEQRPKAEQHDQRQRRRQVAAAVARKLADAGHAKPGEHEQTNQRVDAHQVGRRGTGEGAEG